MSRSKSVDDGTPMFTAPRRAFVHYDNSDSVVNCAYDADGVATPSLTLQSEKDACDINLIVARAAAGEFIEHVNSRPAQWGIDVSEVQDYQSALNFVNAAQEQFMELPANIRARFHNDPQEFFDFVHNPDNVEEGRKLGIFEPEAPPELSPAEPLKAAPAASATSKEGA